LQDLRDHLASKKGLLAEDARQESPNFSMHMADAGTDTYDRDWALSMLSSEQNALYEIDQAMNRIRDGTYGTCEFTGKKIETERLQAIPWTRFTAEAERELEQNGSVQRAQLGTRGSVAAVARSAEMEQRAEEAQEEAE
jgi:DnaK suppressor protein